MDKKQYELTTGEHGDIVYFYEFTFSNNPKV